MRMTVAEVETKIAAEAPPQDSAFATAVGGMLDKKDFDKPWWTGWKSTLSSWTSLYISPDSEVEVPEEHGYVGQWVCFLDNPQRGAYVVVPNMKSGVIPFGATFDITGERVTKDTPVEELERLIEQGYHVLMELVAQEKAKAA